MKVLIAGGAAVLLASSLGASAADLAKRAPVAVDYVKVCDAYGEGFFYIPGSETCLKIGGYVRFDATAGRDDFDIFTAGRDGDRFSTMSRLQLQVDARTETSFGALRSFAAINAQISSGTEILFEVDQAYIQWGGLTAGKAQSFFDFFTGYAPAVNYGELVHDDKVNLVAYTFGFANGLSATISLEDSTMAGRQEADLVALDESGVYGGNRAPDVVANLKLEQGWGAAQVMGVLHNVYGDDVTPVDKWGFALGAGLTIKLPAFGADDEFGIQAAYADGAIRYLGFNLPYAYDFDAVTGARSSGWGVFAGLKHGFTPTVVGALQGGYIAVDAAYDLNDMELWDVSASLTWTPVANLEITPFVEYRSVSTDLLGDQTGWTGGLRLQRNF